MARLSAAILVVYTLSSLPGTLLLLKVVLKAGKTETFPMPFSHGSVVKLLKGNDDVSLIIYKCFLLQTSHLFV